MEKIKRNVVIVDSSKIKNKHDIFNLFSKKLSFPNYFGNNWDAFWDCITDLMWLKNKDTLVKIKDYDILKQKEEGKILIKILTDAKTFWKKHNVDFDLNIFKEK